MHCDNCGAEIFEGQRFCRSCGRPTERHSEENVPTQMMPPGGRRPVDTAPPANPYTNPVYTPPGYYQPAVPVSPVPTYTPPRTRSGWGWIVAMIGVVVLSFIVMGALFFARSRGRQRIGPPPQSPPGELGREVGLSRANARETDRETRLAPYTIALSANSKFSLQNISGDIRIEGWDRPEAEVSVIMHGGSVEQRRAVPVIPSTEGGNLSLKTLSPGNIQVEYIIKLPRKLAGIALEAMNGDITLSQVGGPLSVNDANGDVNISNVKGGVTVSAKNGSVAVSEITGDTSVTLANGDIQLTDVNGAVEAQTLSGDLNAVFDSVAPAKPIKLQTSHGDIELEFKSGIDADLNARSISGDIEIDEAFGIEVSKQMVGRRATGRIGKGGVPVTVDSVGGDIRITK
jgi:Toastrack DUF4097